MSDFDPSRQAPRQPAAYFVLPPPPPTVVKPIPSWVWVASAVLSVSLVVGSVFLIRWTRKQTHAADAEIAVLHQKMTAGDDAGIFADADPTYRESVSSQTSRNLFDKVRDRLGAPHASKQIGSNFSNDDKLGSFVTLRYRTVFDKGSGKEVICFHRLNGAWKLAAYNVESPLLRANKPDSVVRLRSNP